DYGLVSTFKILLYIFSILIGVNTHGALTRNYFKLQDADFKKYLYNLLIISLASFLIFSILVENIIHSQVLLREIPKRWLSYVVLFAIFESWSKLLLSLWRVQEKALKFGFFNILKALFNVTLTIFLVVYLELGWQGRVLSIISAGLVFGAFSLWHLWHYQISNNYFYINSIQIDHLKNALSFGLPLIPHALSGWVINYIDRFFIASMVGMSDVGIYSVAYQIGNIIGILALSFNQAWSPFLFKELKKDSHPVKVKIVKFTYAYFFIISILAVSLSLVFSVAAPFIIGQDFYDATQYVTWVALGYAANGMYFMVVNYIFYTEKNYFLPFITVFSALINIALNYILIEHNGAVGAAQATTITYAITFVLSWYVAKRVYKMPWNLGEIR
ncbi:MAG: oligosaccharide flippase family protein, partial [Cyanobacteria bacterium P01_B01_bin.77]